VVGKYLFASSWLFLEIFNAETLALAKGMHLEGNVLKMLHYHFKGSDYVVTVGWYDCQIKIISASTLEFEMQDKLQGAKIIRDMCIVEFSKGTFAIAIDKGFTIMTLDIEKHVMRESPAYMTDHALLCLAAVSDRVIAACSFRSNQV
jgi:hypothetical protein